MILLLKDNSNFLAMKLFFPQGMHLHDFYYVEVYHSVFAFVMFYEVLSYLTITLHIPKT